ncbi:hypothetical protein GGS20DRAFT_578264 [Poronia punctata]|nr:hypothetical protein GGS20DRAFT_578264 [Poronia punctata]
MSTSLVLKTACLILLAEFGNSHDATAVILLLLWKTGYNCIASFLQKNWPILPLVAVFGPIYAVIKRVGNRDGEDRLPSWLGPNRPALFPCRISHSTLHPNKRRVQYLRYFVGVPLGWRGVVGGIVSVDCQADSTISCFDINAKDYFTQGYKHLILWERLDLFLNSQGIDTTSYPFAYLLATPRVMGFHFNPISIWYLYSADGDLKLVVTSFNNILSQSVLCFSGQEGNYIGDNDDTNHTVRVGPSGDLDQREVWHQGSVTTPFESQNGAYRLVAYDPLSPNMEGLGLIDSTITLMSSDSHAKHVDHIFATRKAIDISEISLMPKLCVLIHWLWTEVVALFRISQTAVIVFCKRKAEEWRRIREESELELQSPASLKLRYVPSGVYPAVSEQMLSAAAEGEPGTAEELEFSVLTPAFYSRFVHYAHDFEAMFCELNESCTISVSNPRLLPKLVLRKPPAPLTTSNYLDYAYFSVIKDLRSRPRSHGQIVSAQSPADIRGFRLSSMDGYVLANEGAKTRRRYGQIVLKLFVADRIARGNVSILKVQALLLRVVVATIVLWL